MLQHKQLGIKKRKYKKKGKLQYNTKEYSNPFFDKKRKNKANISVPIKVKIIVFIIILVCSFFVWFFIFSQYFILNNIQIEGEGNIPESKIEDIVKSYLKDHYIVFIPQNNYFLFNISKLKNILTDKYKFDYLIIQKSFRNSLKVRYKEKEYKYIWYEAGKHYFIDDQGVIITEANILEMKNLEFITIENVSSSTQINSKIHLDETKINFLNELKNIFYIWKDEFPVEKFVITDDKYIIKIKIINGPEIYFSTKHDANKQMTKLLSTRQEKLKDNFFDKEYINLTIGDSVYIK